jgi:hypothetical protein
LKTRSAPALLGATHRAFTFYLENPFSRLKLARLPPCSALPHRAFTFYLGNPISSIETRSAPALLGATPSRLYLLSRKSHFLDSENSVHSVESRFSSEIQFLDFWFPDSKSGFV